MRTKRLTRMPPSTAPMKRGKGKSSFVFYVGTWIVYMCPSYTADVREWGTHGLAAHFYRDGMTCAIAVLPWSLRA